MHESPKGCHQDFTGDLVINGKRSLTQLYWPFSNWIPFKILFLTLVNDSISDDLDYEIDDRLLPVVYKNILPSDRRAEPIGNSLTLKCFVAADDKILYKWFRNGSVSSL